MRIPRYSIVGRLLAVGLVAIGLACLLSASSPWAGMAVYALMAILTVAPIGVVYVRGFTVHRMMVAIAVTAVLLAIGLLLNDRRRRFAILANDHGLKAIEEIKAKRPGGHLGLWEKYRYAAYHPWFPVKSDLPILK